MLSQSRVLYEIPPGADTLALVGGKKGSSFVILSGARRMCGRIKFSEIKNRVLC